MDYRKLTKEAYKLYTEFCNAYFTNEQAFELTMFCIREFPIFRDMITESQEDYY